MESVQWGLLGMSPKQQEWWIIFTKYSFMINTGGQIYRKICELHVEGNSFAVRVAGEDPSTCYPTLGYEFSRAEIVIYGNWDLCNDKIPSAACGQKVANEWMQEVFLTVEADATSIPIHRNLKSFIFLTVFWFILYHSGSWRCKWNLFLKICSIGLFVDDLSPAWKLSLFFLLWSVRCKKSGNSE